MQITELNDLYNNLIDNGYFTEKELQLITDINGYNIETLNNAINNSWTWTWKVLDHSLYLLSI